MQLNKKKRKTPDRTVLIATFYSRKYSSNEEEKKYSLFQTQNFCQQACSAASTIQIRAAAVTARAPFVRPVLRPSTPWLAATGESSSCCVGRTGACWSTAATWTTRAPAACAPSWARMRDTPSPPSGSPPFTQSRQLVALLRHEREQKELT